MDVKGAGRGLTRASCCNCVRISLSWHLMLLGPEICRVCFFLKLGESHRSIKQKRITIRSYRLQPLVGLKTA